MKKLLLVSVFLPAMMLAMSARAALVAVDFTITVTSASSDTGVAVGDFLVGSYTYDKATTGTLMPGSLFVAATMDYPSALTGMQIDINGTAFGANAGDIRYTDSVDPVFTGDDLFAVNADNNALFGELNSNRLLTSLAIDGSAPASVVDFTTDPNPLLTVPPSDFPALSLFMGFGPFPGSIFSTISGSVSIDNLQTVVPVPAAIWLLGSGLLGLLATGIRKTQLR